MEVEMSRRIKPKEKHAHFNEGNLVQFGRSIRKSELWSYVVSFEFSRPKGDVHHVTVVVVVVVVAGRGDGGEHARHPVPAQWSAGAGGDVHHVTVVVVVVVTSTMSLLLLLLLLLQDAVMVENMHDIPYLPSGQLGPEVTSTLAVVCAEVSKVFYPGPVGVQVLAAANHQALAIAKAAGQDVCLLVDSSIFISIHIHIHPYSYPSIQQSIHPMQSIH